MSFYPDAVFPSDAMNRQGVSLLDASLWLLGFSGVEDAANNEAGGTVDFHEALEHLELAVAMGNLTATGVTTTRARRLDEHLREMVGEHQAKNISFNPNSHVYVQPSALHKWWASQNEHADPLSKPLLNRERDTLLTIIAVLCKAAKYDYETASKTADLIENLAASMGVKIGKTTIREHLKNIPDALGGRTR